jgi:hypothetical protein
MNDYRKSLNQKQSELRQALLSTNQHSHPIQLFLSQHARLHAAEMALSEPWSFEDEVLEGLTGGQIRRIPPGIEHSIAWVLWHLARIEDVTMNLLVAGSPQILLEGNWLERLGVAVRHTGNAMTPEEVADLSNKIDIPALRAYRMAVGRRTRHIVKRLEPEDLKRKATGPRLQSLLDQGAVLPAARGLIDYWGKRNVAGLLLMPPTRHVIVHLNEALKIKKKI